jgi:two-component system, NarL family, response regulator LiaR
MSQDLIRVMIVDDHQIVRKGLRALLETEAKIEIVGEASDGKTAVALASEVKPDVILMDLVMPEMDGVAATREIMTHRPGPNVLVLTSYGSDNKIFPAIKAGALGYLLKDTTPAELIAAIYEAAEGQSSLDPTIARRLLREFSMDEKGTAPNEPLTERELDVLRLVATGRTNERIAEILFISKATVRTHMGSILSKLNLANRTQAALYALREGIASLDEIDNSDGNQH